MEGGSFSENVTTSQPALPIFHHLTFILTTGSEFRGEENFITKVDRQKTVGNFVPSWSDNPWRAMTRITRNREKGAFKREVDISQPFTRWEIL